jgi:hypothetical protein
MLPLICGSILGILLLAALAIAIWQARKYFRSLPEFYRKLQEDNTMWTAVELCHPGWLLLTLVPFKGKDWLKRTLSDVAAAAHLSAMETGDKFPEARPVRLPGGACLLIEEQHERSSGMAESALLHELNRNSRLVSGFTSLAELKPEQIPVYTARHQVMDWAALNRAGDSFQLTPVPNAVCLLKRRDGSLEWCCDGGHHPILSGDRFALGISEFEFLQLPYLALWDAQKKAILCNNIEEDWTDKHFPEFTILRGRLLARDYSFYHPAIPWSSDNPWPMDGILLQPGDRFEFDDGRRLVLLYHLSGRGAT